jgi:hypothetical protein
MSLNSMLRQSITIENPTGKTGKHGDRSFSPAVTVRSRFQQVTKTMVNLKGEREPIDGIVFVGPDATANIGAKVTYLGNQYRIMKREVVPGRNGKTHHLELQVQTWSFGA